MKSFWFQFHFSKENTGHVTYRADMYAVKDKTKTTTMQCPMSWICVTDLTEF